MRFALPRQLSNKSILINISSRVSICQSLHLTASVGILPPHRFVPVDEGMIHDFCVQVLWSIRPGTQERS